MALTDWTGSAVKLIRNVDRLLTAEAKHGKAIEKLADEISVLKERLARLEERFEAREEVVLTKAGAAASAAATQVAMHNLSEIWRRVAALEAQREQPRPSQRLPGRRAKKADPD